MQRASKSFAAVPTLPQRPPKPVPGLPASFRIVALARLPQKGVEIYAAPRVEADAFFLEKLPLSDRALARKGDGALRVHDSLPRNAGTGRQGVHGVTNQSRLPVQTGEPSHLPVGRDASARNSRDDLVNASVRSV